MSYIQPADRHQFTLMNSLDDLVPADQPIRLLDEIIERIVRNNPQQFGKETVGDVGRPEYSPSVFLKLYFYGFFNGIRSSRKLEVETKRNIEVIWLLGTLSPDHWTISAYRKDHGDQIKFVTTKFREFLYDGGFIKGSTVAIDGSKFKANAKREMLTLEKIEKRMKRADENLEQYLQILAKNDWYEDTMEELDDVEPKAEREAILVDKIAELQEKLEELTRQKETLEELERKCLSSTDSDAHLMKSRDGKIPAYNAQIVVDSENMLIADSEVITDESDRNALPVMMESLAEELGVVPKEVLADKGYYTPDLIEKIEKDEQCTCYIPYTEQKETKEDITFQYNEKTDTYRCSEGKPLVLRARNQRRRESLVDMYVGTQCDECRIRSDCTTSKQGRFLDRYHNQDWRDQYKRRIDRPLSKLKIGLRKCIAEHPFGTIKCWGGKIPLLLRGVEKVATEINLYTTGYNLKRFFMLDSFEMLFDSIKEYNWKTA